MNMIKISAVIPFYNSEAYIERCIQSILNQSYNEFEAIFVDDGSQDSSLSILRQYEQMDSRIIVIHQENAGPGAARNTGINVAVGDYIVFIDSDDLIDKDYFYKISQKKEDIIFIDVNQVNENYELIKTEYMSDKSNLSKDQFIRKQMTGSIEWGGVRKVVKRELLLENGIAYTNHKIGEEAVFSFLALYYANTIAFIKGPVYTYINREGSQSDYKIDNPWGPVAIVLRNKVKELGIYDEFADTINSFLITAEVVALDRIASTNRYTLYRKKAKEFIKEFDKQMDKTKRIDYKSMSKKVLLLYPLLRTKAFFLIYIASKVKRLLKK